MIDVVSVLVVIAIMMWVVGDNDTKSETADELICIGFCQHGNASMRNHDHKPEDPNDPCVKESKK